jgi:DDE superfamily endonuclease
MVAYIRHDAPELFDKPFPDGSCFRCSETFVRVYLHTLGWSERCATRPAQKLPANHEQILSDSFLRQACIIRNHGIPPELRVNTDQTQTVYQMGGKQTWNKAGEKQVTTMGMDEKRAFTLVPSISASGELLPMQTIFHGQTTASCPSKGARRYNEVLEYGFKFEPSQSYTYWSTQATMQSLVIDIIAPYFDKKKEELNLPASQCSMWMIDCWSVHKSEEFQGWMKQIHANIIISFVPANMTGLAQPLDVGIQCALKHSMKRSAHKDVVDETMAHLDAGTPETAFKLDTTLGTLRDCSVAWILNAYHDINKKELILKVSVPTLLRLSLFDVRLYLGL